MKHHAFLAIVLLAISLPSERANACASLTKAGEKAQRKQYQRYLRKEADKVVRGTWHTDGITRYPDDGNLYGYIEVNAHRKILRYRLAIFIEINCGFPNYSIEDGDYGIFFLKNDEFEKNDMKDGFIDNFQFVHFQPLKRN